MREYEVVGHRWLKCTSSFCGYILTDKDYDYPNKVRQKHE